jgi:hypothetical protein
VVLETSGINTSERYWVGLVSLHHSVELEYQYLGLSWNEIRIMFFGKKV